jgi:FtsP/CotA-like multicopper oxidase with cupredoxin domain
VNGITECPIPPGGWRIYSFIATQHGTTWYHSHTSAQYGDGVLGSMIINGKMRFLVAILVIDCALGPAVLNYEEDLGTLPLSDYFAGSMWQEYEKVLPAGASPPTALGATFNGTMKNPSTNTGYYFNRTLKSNTTYRLRLINTAVDNGFAVSLDHHKMNVIAADFVPIQNYTTDWLLINIGQRYDVVFTTDQGDGNYVCKFPLLIISCSHAS